METMDNNLLLCALNEIAEALGHSNQNPISVSLLCLNCGISFEEQGKIMIAFNCVTMRGKIYLFSYLEKQWRIPRRRQRILVMM